MLNAMAIPQDTDRVARANRLARALLVDGA
jgi:hypothetical protein